eukprot:scaffold51280_cov39-Phaeocystis_antarctica.AAC.1
MHEPRQDQRRGEPRRTAPVRSPRWAPRYMSRAAHACFLAPHLAVGARRSLGGYSANLSPMQRDRQTDNRQTDDRQTTDNRRQTDRQHDDTAGVRTQRRRRGWRQPRHGRRKGERQEARRRFNGRDQQAEEDR